MDAANVNFSRWFALIAYVTDSERSFQTTPLARASGPPERGRERIRRKHGALLLTLNWSLNGSLNGYPLWPTTEVAFAAGTSASEPSCTNRNSSGAVINDAIIIDKIPITGIANLCMQHRCVMVYCDVSTEPLTERGSSCRYSGRCSRRSPVGDTSYTPWT